MGAKLPFMTTLANGRVGWKGNLGFKGPWPC
jgi:hypothetical protein